MIRVKVIRSITDLLIFIDLSVFIGLLFLVFQYPDQFDLLYNHLWSMLAFPIFAAWLVFARNRLIEYLTQSTKKDIEVEINYSESENVASLSDKEAISLPAENKVDKDKN